LLYLLLNKVCQAIGLSGEAAGFYTVVLFSPPLSVVVCGIRKTIQAAYQAGKENLGVSFTSVYNNLNGVVLDNLRPAMAQQNSRREPDGHWAITKIVKTLK